MPWIIDNCAVLDMWRNTCSHCCCDSTSAFFVLCQNFVESIITNPIAWRLIVAFGLLSTTSLNHDIQNLHKEASKVKLENIFDYVRIINNGSISSIKASNDAAILCVSLIMNQLCWTAHSRLQSLSADATWRMILYSVPNLFQKSYIECLWSFLIPWRGIVGMITRENLVMILVDALVQDVCLEETSEGPQTGHAL